jgi:hypothetical protein
VARSSAGRHPANVGALVAGIVFCGIALGWLLFETGALHLADLQWAVPGLLTGAGLAGVLVSVLRGRNGRTR